MCFESALLMGNTIDFQTFFCNGPDGKYMQWFNYHLEVVSRSSVKMSVKVERSREWAESEDNGSYEFVRR